LTSEQFAELDLQLTETSLGAHSHSQTPNGFKVAHLLHLWHFLERNCTHWCKNEM